MNRAIARVLVVEDHPVLGDYLRALLEYANLQATVTAFGEQALALASTEPFDLILLDIDLPGMDGLEVCRRLKQDPRLRWIPVLFLTACPDYDTLMAAYELGAADYIPKPIASVELTARILAALEQSRSGGASPDAPPSQN